MYKKRTTSEENQLAGENLFLNLGSRVLYLHVIRVHTTLEISQIYDFGANAVHQP